MRKYETKKISEVMCIRIGWSHRAYCKEFKVGKIYPIKIDNIFCKPFLDTGRHRWYANGFSDLWENGYVFKAVDEEDRDEGI